MTDQSLKKCAFNKKFFFRNNHINTIKKKALLLKQIVIHQ